jgi:Tfp pilus assembly protein PilO
MAVKPSKTDFKNLSIREMVIIVGTLLSAVGYGFFHFEYSVQMKKIKNLENQSAEVQTSLTALQKVMTSPENIKKTKEEIIKIKDEILELQTIIEKAKARLTGQDLEILNQLQNEADFYGVFLKSIKTSENSLSRAGLNLKEVSLVMDIESDYDALKNFVASLRDFPAVLTIQSLETTRNEKILPKLESRLHIKVIVL